MAAVRCLVLLVLLSTVMADLHIDERFIVEGSGNTVSGNHIENNENTYVNNSATAGGATSSPITSGGGTGGLCDYQGVHHGPGDIFPAGDGCNKCTCSPLGAACTTHICSGKRDSDIDERFIVEGSGNEVLNNKIENNENTFITNSSTGGATSSGTSGSTSGTSGNSTGSGIGFSSPCDYQGVHHSPGDIFPSVDGCNKCTCSPLGAACTTHTCGGKRGFRYDFRKRFLVTGSNNTVSGNSITNNENTNINTGSSSGGTSGTSSGSNTGSSSGSSGSGAFQNSCDYHGVHHGPGDIFEAGDGCNKCTCSPLGAACTTHACGGKRGLGDSARRFIVEGNNNHVDNNVITNNENNYTNSGSSGGASGSNTGGTSGSSTAATSGLCDYQGVHHSPGDVFPAGDGCNKCTCSPLGPACTTHICSGKRGALLAARFIVEGDGNVVDNNIIVNNENTFGSRNHSGSSSSSSSSGSSSGSSSSSSSTPTCNYGGHIYHESQTFLASDGCNQCTCMAAGVMCTRNPCPTQPTYTATAQQHCADAHPDPTHCSKPGICQMAKEKLYNCQKTCGVC